MGLQVKPLFGVWKMVSLKLVLLLLIGLQDSALPMVFNLEGSPKVADNLRATGDVCQDCTQIFGLVVDMLSNTDLQKKMIDGLEDLCDRLPGPSSAAKICHEKVDQVLPLAFTFITGAIKPHQACILLGLCGSQSHDKQERLLISYIQEGLKATLTLDKALPTTQCNYCILLFQTLESLLPKEETVVAMLDVMEEFCTILPVSYQGQCKALIAQFGKVLVERLLSYATPQAICTFIQICEDQKMTSSIERPFQDPCILRGHMCKDFKTALKCGTVSFCQRVAWKAVPSNVF